MDGFENSLGKGAQTVGEMGEVEGSGFGREVRGGDEAFDGGAAGVEEGDGGTDVELGDAETGAEFHEIGG